MKQKVILIGTLILILSLVSPIYAESNKMKVLKGVYDVAKDFIKSDSAVFFQSSAAYVPKNYSLNSIGNYSQNQGLNSIFPENSYNSTTPYSLGANSNYYPVSASSFQKDSVLMNSPGYTIEPESNLLQPTGEIFLINARKEDVYIILSEFCSDQGWSVNKITEHSGYDDYSKTPNYYKISFTRYGSYGTKDRHLVVTISQLSNGTSMKTYSSTFLVREHISKLLSHLNTYYATQVSNFQ